MKILFSLYFVPTQNTLFDAVEFQQIYCEKQYVLDDAYLTPLPQHVQYLFIEHIDKITHINVILKILYLTQV